MGFLDRLNEKQLLEALKISQASLSVISFNLNVNSRLSAQSGKKYRPDKQTLTGIHNNIRRVLDSCGEIRARNAAREKWNRQGLANVPEQIRPAIVSLVHYHPAVQKRFLKRLSEIGDGFSRQWAIEERKRMKEDRTAKAAARARKFRGRP